MLSLLFVLAHAEPIRLAATTLTATVGVDELAAGSVTLEFDGAVKQLTKKGIPCAAPVAGGLTRLVLTPATECKELFRFDGDDAPTFQLEDAAGKFYPLTFALREPALKLPSVPICVEGVAVGAQSPDPLCAGRSGLGANLGVKVAPGADGRERLVAANGGGTSWKGKGVHYFDRYHRKWVALDVADDNWMSFTGPLAVLLQQDPTALRVRATDGKTDTAWSFVKLTKPAAAAGAGAGTTCDAVEAKIDAAFAYVLCVDLTAPGGASPAVYSRYAPRDGTPRLTLRRPKREKVPHVYLIPNVPIYVVALVPQGQSAGILGDGSPGVAEDAADSGFEKLAPLELAEAPDAVQRTAWAVLSPRQPGPFQVLVHTSRRKADDTIETSLAYTHEFIVLQRYFGALRTGMAVVHAPDEREYTVIGDDDSAQLAVARERGTVWDPELAVGFSTYLFNRAKMRVPHINRGLTPYWLPYVGLYTGLGVVAPGQTDLGVTALRSVYLGLDFEVSPHFSVTVAGVARRSREPLAPYTEGSILPSKDTEWGAVRPSLGVAFLVNVTPWYFRQLGAPFSTVGTTR